MQLFFASENFYFSWFYIVVDYSFSLLCNILEIENKAIYNEMI